MKEEEKKIVEYKKHGFFAKLRNSLGKLFTKNKEVTQGKNNVGKGKLKIVVYGGREGEEYISDKKIDFGNDKVEAGQKNIKNKENKGMKTFYSIFIVINLIFGGLRACQMVKRDAKLEQPITRIEYTVEIAKNLDLVKAETVKTIKDALNENTMTVTPEMEEIMYEMDKLGIMVGDNLRDLNELSEDKSKSIDNYRPLDNITVGEAIQINVRAGDEFANSVRPEGQNEADLLAAQAKGLVDEEKMNDDLLSRGEAEKLQRNNRNSMNR